MTTMTPSEKKIASFLNHFLGGCHLSGFKYLVSVIDTQKPNNLYGATAKKFKMDYKQIERSIRYYFAYIEKMQGEEKFRQTLNIETNTQLSNKNIIGKIILIMSK